LSNDDAADEHADVVRCVFYAREGVSAFGERLIERAAGGATRRRQPKSLSLSLASDARAVKVVLRVRIHVCVCAATQCSFFTAHVLVCRGARWEQFLLLIRAAPPKIKQTRQIHFPPRQPIGRLIGETSAGKNSSNAFLWYGYLSPVSRSPIYTSVTNQNGFGQSGNRISVSLARNLKKWHIFISPVSAKIKIQNLKTMTLLKACFIYY
jgi:hypothetical protein